MIHDEEPRDPLAAAFDSYERAPKDVVPKQVDHTVDDLRRLADGSAQVQVTHYELDEHGITRHTEWVSIAPPVINTNREENP